MMIINIASYHTDRGNWNQFNPGLEWRKGEIDGKKVFGGDAMAGFYLNSINRISVYAGVVYPVMRYGAVSLNVDVGLITGYVPPLLPAVIPEFQMQIKNWSTLVRLLPIIKSGDLTGAAFTLSIGKTF